MFLIICTGVFSFFSKTAFAVEGKHPNIAEGSHGGRVIMNVIPNELDGVNEKTATIEAAFPIETTDIKFFAALGKIENEEVVSESRVKVKYTAPSGFAPMIDVVASLAIIDGKKEWSYCTVILIGFGSAIVQTKSGSEAIIKIGDQVFGPVVADQKGRAVIQVEVPPGVNVGYDAQNYPVDLNLPKTQKVVLFAETNKVNSKSTVGVSLFSVVLNPDGFIDKSNIPTITADRGIIQQVEPIFEGAFKSRYFPPLEGEGLVHVEAFVANDNSPYSKIELSLVSNQPGESNEDIDSSKALKQDEAAQDSADIYWTLKPGYVLMPPRENGFSLSTDIGISFYLGSAQFFVGIDGRFTVISTNSKDRSSEDNRFSMTTWSFPLAIELGYRKALGNSFNLALFGRGGFIHTVNQSATSIGGGENYSIKESQNNGLIGAGTSFEWSIGPGSVLIQAHYNWFPGSFELIKDGVYSSLFVDAGYRFWF